MAFQGTAIRIGIMDAVQKSGLKVTDKGLDEAMAENAAFQQDGKFSIEKYNAMSMSARLSLRGSTKEDLLVRRYYEDLYTIAPSTAEIAFVASMAKPQREISYAFIPLADFPAGEVASWGNKNADLFRTLGVSRITVTSSESTPKDSQRLGEQTSFEMPQRASPRMPMRTRAETPAMSPTMFSPRVPYKR